ncbi:MAG: hypothetical protein JW909_13705 [Planctomycetes bacterium]|nr:hypothetical protein [Planctomycetota bacterium]
MKNLALAVSAAGLALLAAGCDKQDDGLSAVTGGIAVSCCDSIESGDTACPFASGDTPASTGLSSQSFCPVVWGAPVDRSIFTDCGGKRVYFSGAACVDVFSRDPEKYMCRLRDAGVLLEDSPAFR